MIITIITAIFIIVAFLAGLLYVLVRYLKEKDTARLADSVHTLRICEASRRANDARMVHEAKREERLKDGKIRMTARDDRDTDGVFYDEWYGACNTGPWLAEEKSYTEADKLKRLEKLKASKRLEAKILRKALKKAKDDAALAKVPKKSSKRKSK